jgi:hypothetical protein
MENKPTEDAIATTAKNIIVNMHNKITAVVHYRLMKTSVCIGHTFLMNKLYQYGVVVHYIS